MGKKLTQIKKKLYSTILSQFIFKRSWLFLISILIWISTFPPLNLSFLSFIAFIPLLEYLYSCPSWKQGIKTGFVFGFLTYFTQGYWVYNVCYKTIGSLTLSFIPWLGLSIGGGMLFILPILLIRICFVINLLWAIPFVWTLGEIFRSFLPVFHFPWCLAYIPLANIPYLAQHAALGTAYLVSTWVITINLIIYLLIRKRKTLHQVFIPLTACLALFIYSLVRWYNPNPKIKQLKVVAAQLGINVSYAKENITQRLVQTLGYSIIDFAENNKADLVVFGEGIINSNVNFTNESPFGKIPKVPFLYGTIRQEGNVSYQSSLLYQNKKWTSYDKLRLVAFGEYIPFRNLFSFATAMGAPKKDISCGITPKIMQLENCNFGNMICFESLFSDIAWQQAAKGAQFLVIISQDDWFQGTTFLDYLKLASIYRGIETGLPIVRATNLGYTFFSDSRGNIKLEAPLNQFVPLTNSMEIPKQSDAFRYAWVFPWIVYFVGIMITLNYFFVFVKQKKLSSLKN